MIKLASIVLSGFAINVTVAPALATSIVFAGYTQTGGAQNFVLTSTPLIGSPNSFSVTIAGSGPVSFSYLIGGTPFANSAQAAILKFSVTSIVTGHCPSPTPNCISDNVTFTEAGFSGSFAITRRNPFDGSSGGHSNLLSGIFSLLSPGALFTANTTGSTATLEATSTSSNPNQVVFTSDFLNFANTIDRDATFNFSVLTSLVQSFTGFSVIHNTFVDSRWPNNFSAISSASFADAPVEVPEPSTLALPAIGLLAFCLRQRKRRPLHR